MLATNKKRLNSLQVIQVETGGAIGKRTWRDRFGSVDKTLPFIVDYLLILDKIRSPL